MGLFYRPRYDIVVNDKLIVYDKMSETVLRQIASDNLCGVKLLTYTNSSKTFQIFTIGQPSYINDTYFEYLKWYKNERSYFQKKYPNYR